MWGNFSLNVSFMSFFRSDGLTYSITVVWRKERKEKKNTTEVKEWKNRGSRRFVVMSYWDISKSNNNQCKWTWWGHKHWFPHSRGESRTAFLRYPPLFPCWLHLHDSYMRCRYRWGGTICSGKLLAPKPKRVESGRGAAMPHHAVEKHYTLSPLFAPLLTLSCFSVFWNQTLMMHWGHTAAESQPFKIKLIFSKLLLQNFKFTCSINCFISL